MNEHCEYCNGSGWVPVPVERNGIVYDCVDRCACSPLPQMPAQAAESRNTARDQSRKLREVGL